MLLRLGQAAARLGVCNDTVKRWIDTGRLEAVRLPTTGERRVSAEAVERVLHEMRHVVAHSDPTGPRRPAGQGEFNDKGAKS